MEPLQNIHLTFKCPKTLNDLAVCNSDWYCTGCNRLIMDFRGMEENQILNSLNNGDKLHCAVFDTDRIAYILQPKWQRWLSAGLIALGLTTLNSRVFAQQTDKTSQADTTKGKQVIATDSVKGEITVGVFSFSVLPEYPGGISRFYDYLKKNLSNISVKETKNTVIKFTIEKDGSLVDVKLVQEGDNKIDQQLIRLIKNRKWKPGIMNGRPLAVDYNCYVTITASGLVDIKVEQISRIIPK